jgi:hypothetical protein
LDGVVPAAAAEDELGVVADSVQGVGGVVAVGVPMMMMSMSWGELPLWSWWWAAQDPPMWACSILGMERRVYSTARLGP